ncbi:MAG TPA: hypothetical protein VMP13_06360 [Acidimicrobiia bacterium]|nr:hypothetical protein [Acidimicrobiia bacterium]
MNSEEASREILRIRNRLAGIESEREVLPEDAFSERTDLLDEEHELQSLLAQLQDSLMQNARTEQIAVDKRTPPVL